MIGGVHTILYSQQADEVRAFFRDVLEFPWVNAGSGWLIFAAPPGELAVHPAEGRAYHELYLMCADVKAEVARLVAKGVEFTMPITKERWGLVTQLRLPDGETLGLYEPKHPMAIQMSTAKGGGDKKETAKRKKVGAGKSGKPRQAGS